MMRSKLRHTPAIVGALLLAACADDAATQDTDASSSSETGDEDPTDPDPTTDTEPDPDSSSSTDNPTADTTAEESSSDDGSCVIPMYAFADPSFESGANMSDWGEASSAFDTPLCDANCGEAATPQDGAWLVWLGGTQAATGDTGGVSQVVTLTEADSLELSFYFWWQAVGSGTDIFQLQVDGDVLWEINAENQADYTGGWTEVTVDISAYADGGDHDFDFTGFASAGANLFLDNIQTSGCDAGSGVTETDTVDPYATGGESESESETDTGGMLTCEDLGNTLPIAQDGNNSGTGDDIDGSCITPGGDDAGEDVGYTWTAPADGIYRFDTLGSPLDTVLILLEDCEGGAELACNDDAAMGVLQSSIIFSMTMGQTVAIAVDGWSSGDLDDFTLNINQIGCEDPIDLGNNEPIEQDDDNMGAGDDVSASCGGNGGEDVIYTWTAPDDAIYNIYAVSLQMAPVVSAYSGTCGDPNTEIGCASGNGLAAFTTVLSQDQEITVVVDGADADAVGAYELNIEQAGTLAGDCCAADDSAGCESAATTQCVCGYQPVLDGPFPAPSDCCSGDWTAECAGVAFSQCDAGCAGIDGGSCCVGDSMEADCDVPEVSDCVCAFDDYCCSTEWDAVCVAKAETFCFAECA